MRIRRGIVAPLLAVAIATLSVSSAQATSSVPRPLAGHWKIEKAFSEGATGGLVISKSRTTVRLLRFTPELPLCAATQIRLVGTFHLYKVATDKHGDSDNTPDWAITKKVTGVRKVTARQGGKTIHGTLSLTFGSKNGTRKPVRFVDGEFRSTGCTVFLGGAHG